MAVNYKGRPFMIASTENRPMLYSLLACCAGTFVAAFEVIPMLNDKLQLVPLPNDAFRHQVSGARYCWVTVRARWVSARCAPDASMRLLTRACGSSTAEASH
jgi:hypothetical protein